MTGSAVGVLVACIPVLCFLGALTYLDSYKLVRVRGVLALIAVGCLVAGLAYLLNTTLMARIELDSRSYSRYVAPVTEELCKALLLIALLAGKRVGFLVDAAIFGFAIGTGFAVLENVYYLNQMPHKSAAVWVVRGFGTAIMHGGTTAIFGILSKELSGRFSAANPVTYVPGLLVAMSVHSIFNHFLFLPLLSTLGILIALPALVVLTFQRSERSLKAWLGVGFDADTELLRLLNSGGFSESRTGQYLLSLKQRFRGEVVADLLCYLRLHVELSLRAKGILMMREIGFAPPQDPQLREKFAEMKYLERSIGKTGRLAILPFLHFNDRDLWQLYMLERR